MIDAPYNTICKPTTPSPQSVEIIGDCAGTFLNMTSRNSDDGFNIFATGDNVSADCIF